MNPIAWLATDPKTGDPVRFLHTRIGAATYEADGTVADVEALLAEYDACNLRLERSGTGEDLDALRSDAAAAKTRLLSFASCSAPPEGAPTWEEVADALSGAEEELRKAAAYYSRQGWWDNELDARTSRSTVRALLSRLPHLQEGTDL